MSNTKAYKSTSPPVNLILIAILYQIILILNVYVLLGGFEPGYEVLDVYVVDTKFVECISNEDLIFYDRNKSWVDIFMIHVEFLCWYYSFVWIKYLGLPMRYIYWILCGVGRQEYLTVETFLRDTSSRGWGDEVCKHRVLRGGCDRPLIWRESVFLCSPDCIYLCNYYIDVLEYTQQVHEVGREVGGLGGVITNIIWFCEHYNGLLLHLITHIFLLLDFFYVSIL